MATYPYIKPILLSSPQYDQPDILPFSLANAQTPVDGDLVSIASGVISKCASNVDTGILGFMAQDYNATWGQSQTYGSVNKLLALAGSAQGGGSAYFPAYPQTNAQPLVGVLHATQDVLMSVSNSWNDNLIGTEFGILLDTASGDFVLDNTQGNSSVVLVKRKRGGPLDGGVLGDIGVIVVCTFVGSTLAFP